MGRSDSAAAEKATKDAETKPLRAWLLGTPRIVVGERELTDEAWPRRGARSLLLLMLSTPGHRLPRDVVLDTLWPDADTSTATNSLYLSMHTLRRALEPGLPSGRQSGYVRVGGGTVGLDQRADVFVDTDAFRSAIARADAAKGRHRAAALREAVTLYGGDFLADEPYSDWPVATRERLRRDWRRSVLELADVERDAGRPLVVVPALEMLVGSDQTDEAVQRAIMRAQAAAGNRDEALRQFAHCVAVLRDELDANPAEETVALAESIRSGAPTAPVMPTVPALRLPPVPVPPTRLIGRAADLAALELLLADREIRLVTLVGPGGIGKTRLAIEAVMRVAQGADDVAFVALATVRDPDLVLPTIARALGIEETPDRPSAEQLRDALYQRSLLLVLDNLEHLIDAAPDLAALLEGNVGLRLLVTSREPLHVRAERVDVVPPIAVPALGAPDAPEGSEIGIADIGSYDGVALFVDRAQAVRPGFELTTANAPVIGAICARLDGLPLAIELAAARCRHLQPADLLGRLERRLPVLTGGPRDLPARLRTMHDAIGWSYELLDETERRVFRRVSVFVGGCTLDAAEAVAGPSDSHNSDPARRTMQNVIESLVDKSLVNVDRSEPNRFGMLETVREYGLLKLAELGEEPAVRLAHAAHFLDWAESAATRLTGPEQHEWLQRIEREHNNLRATFETLVGTDDIPDGALRLSRALFHFWRTRGYFTEGRATVERALERRASRNRARAWALAAGADMAATQGDHAAAEAMYADAVGIFDEHTDLRGIAEATAGMAMIALARADLPLTRERGERALVLSREIGDSRGVAVALNSLAAAAFYSGEFDAAAELWKQCVEAVTAAGDEHALSIVLSNLGAVELIRGQPAQAIERHIDSLAIARRLGDTAATIPPLINIGRAFVAIGRTDEARRYLEEAREVCAQHGDRSNGSEALQVLGMTELAEGRPSEAANFLGQSLAMQQSVGDRIRVATTLELVAGLAVSQGDAEAATEIFGGTEAMREETGAKRETIDESAYVTSVAAAREALGPDRFAEAWARGRALSVDAVAQEAFAALGAIADANERAAASAAR